MVDTKFSKIVVGVDGSKESIETANYAIRLAKKDDTQIIALTVLNLPNLNLFRYSKSSICCNRPFT